jgi:hypothetical protein
MDPTELLLGLRKETLQLAGELKQSLNEIERILGRARRPLAKVTKRVHIEVTARYRNGAASAATLPACVVLTR